ncbi:MAG: hypothetical protein AB8G95_29425 [Anaerolineae bacterium]
MKTSILFIFAFFFIPILPIQQDADLRQRTVIVTVVDADGNRAAEKMMELSIRKPLTRIKCTTGVDGRCEMVFGTNEDLVNGIILILGAGRHPVLFKGDSVEIEIRLTEQGLIDIPHDVHSEPPPTLAPAEIVPTEEPVAAEAIIQPTETELVETTAEENEDETTLEVTIEDIEEPEVELTIVAEESGLAGSDTPGRFEWVWWLIAVLFVGILGGVGWFYTQKGAMN